MEVSVDYCVLVMYGLYCSLTTCLVSTLKVTANMYLFIDGNFSVLVDIVYMNYELSEVFVLTRILTEQAGCSWIGCRVWFRFVICSLSVVSSTEQGTHLGQS